MPSPTRGEGASLHASRFTIHAFILILVLLISFTGIKTNAQEIVKNSDLVKIAISNNDFKSLVYNQISIIATAPFTIYDKATKKPIFNCQSANVAKVTFNSDGFDLSVNNKTVAKNLKGTIVFDSPYGLLGVENLKRNGKQALYHGTFELTPKDNNSFYLINVLDVQSYLKGVVPNEMPVRFGLEALKAQAVAARNYVLMPRTRAYKEFDVDDSVASQVYFGANTEKELSNEAVAQTEGLVALYGWDLILAQYCSTAGGYTEDYENAFSDKKNFPAKSKAYLKGRPDMLTVGKLNREDEAKLFYMSYPDSYDMKSPYYRWQKEFEIKELEETLTKTLPAQSKTGFVKPEFNQGDVLGNLQELKVNKRGVSGKVMELEIVTDKGSWCASKEIVIRRLLQKNNVSLPSANVVFEHLYDKDKKLVKIAAYGGGFGHGVGMSQFGAGFMSVSLHKSFDKILKRYYTGITISTIPVILSSEEGQKTAFMQFFAPSKQAILVIDNKYQIKKFSANMNNKKVEFQLTTSLLPGNRVSRIDISQYLKQGSNNVILYFPDNERAKGIRLYVELVGKDECEYNF